MSIKQTLIEPIISINDKDDETLKFTLSGVDVSVANAIRRVILSDINLPVFRTTPNEANQSNFITNTTRLNNEILKQRLSCIPIHLKSDVDFTNLLLEVNEENTTDTIYMVSSRPQNFKIKNTVTNTYLPDETVLQIFPPFNGEYFIDFVRLRPRISNEIPGEKIHFTCKFDVGNAKENSMFNAVGTCGYGFTVHKEDAEKALAQLRLKWAADGADVEFESKNWNLLEAKRYTIKNSFEFEIKTVCAFENTELIYISCQELINKFTMLIRQITEHKMDVKDTGDAYDYILSNEDYTVGNLLNHLLYKNYYEGQQLLTYCGFKKMHPHDTDSIIRIKHKINDDVNTAEDGFEYILTCCGEAIEIFTKIMANFKRDEDTVNHFNLPDIDSHDMHEGESEWKSDIVKTPSPRKTPPGPLTAAALVPSSVVKIPSPVVKIPSQVVKRPEVNRRRFEPVTPDTAPPSTPTPEIDYTQYDSPPAHPDADTDSPPYSTTEPTYKPPI
jgi:DNA-directed RNA polymerase subunit L